MSVTPSFPNSDPGRSGVEAMISCCTWRGAPSPRSDQRLRPLLPRRRASTSMLLRALVPVACASVLLSAPAASQAQGFSPNCNPPSAAELRPPAPAAGVRYKPFGAYLPPHELGSPLRRYRRVRGVMLTIHGGGWYVIGTGAMTAERAVANRWRLRGWTTLNVSYRRCALSTRDVVRFYDILRRRYGPRMPICATGASAGGHLAQYLAARRRVACVISEAGPSDLQAWRYQRTYNYRTRQLDLSSAESVYQLGATVFGAVNLRYYSPIHRIPPTARYLLATAWNDGLVSLSQDRNMARALRRRGRHVQRLVLSPGPVLWVHASVSQASLDRLYQAERALVAPLERR